MAPDEYAIPDVHIFVDAEPIVAADQNHFRDGGQGVEGYLCHTASSGLAWDFVDVAVVVGEGISSACGR